MQWLREKPDDLNELDEARRYAEDVGDDESDEGVDMEADPERKRPGASVRRGIGAANGGASPMAVETNGDTSFA